LTKSSFLFHLWRQVCRSHISHQKLVSRQIVGKANPLRAMATETVLLGFHSVDAFCDSLFLGMSHWQLDKLSAWIIAQMHGFIVTLFRGQLRELLWMSQRWQWC